MKKNMDSRKGVALAEVVIALVVITIISVATLTVMFSSVQIENKTIVAMDVRNQAENAIECFRFADGNVATFVRCLNKTTEGSGRYFVKKTETPLVYVLDKGGYTITIEINSEMTGFTFTAKYANKEEPIHEFSFPRAEGGGQQ